MLLDFVLKIIFTKKRGKEDKKKCFVNESYAKNSFAFTYFNTVGFRLHLNGATELRAAAIQTLPVNNIDNLQGVFAKVIDCKCVKIDGVIMKN